MTDQPTQSKRDVVERLLRRMISSVRGDSSAIVATDFSRILSIVGELDREVERLTGAMRSRGIEIGRLERENGETRATLRQERDAWKRIAEAHAIDRKLLESELATLRSRGEGIISTVNVKELIENIHAQREEILSAFIAHHGYSPHEVEQVEERTETGTRWYVRKRIQST